MTLFGAFFPSAVLLTFLGASIVLALSPGPDNLLTISRGLSQGRLAAVVCALGCGCGAYCHVLAAAFGLTLLIQQSALAFMLLKFAGAGYLLYLGWQAWRAQGLIHFQRSKQLRLWRIGQSGFLSAALNPKPGLFVMAFIPQFIHPNHGNVAVQMLVYGAIFVGVAVLTFAVMGISAAALSQYLAQRPKAVKLLNWGTGAVFVAAALSVLGLRSRTV